MTTLESTRRSFLRAMGAGAASGIVAGSARGWQVNAVMILVPGGKSYMMSVALVMSLYRHHAGKRAVKVVDTPADLDATASRTGNRLYVHVANAHRRRDITTSLSVAGMRDDSGRVFTLVADPEAEMASGKTHAILDGNGSSSHHRRWI